MKLKENIYTIRRYVLNSFHELITIQINKLTNCINDALSLAQHKIYQ